MTLDLQQVLKIASILVGCWATGYFSALGLTYCKKVLEKI